MAAPPARAPNKTCSPCQVETWVVPRKADDVAVGDSTAARGVSDGEAAVADDRRGRRGDVTIPENIFE